MNELCFMGYKVNKKTKYFLPGTILFSNEKEVITVSMIRDAVDYILGIIATYSQLEEPYKTAKVMFGAIKMMLENKKPSRLNKTDIKTEVGALEKIINLSAKSENERVQNARSAFLCKLTIDRFAGMPTM
ncbi:MAG: hypothetical protein HFH91_07975 [Lachnospiraceae bacterium]|nr:hypothetical protein [Lachnospiraceae bacterium]